MVPTAVPFSQRSIFETVEESRHTATVFFSRVQQSGC